MVPHSPLPRKTSFLKILRIIGESRAPVHLHRVERIGACGLMTVKTHLSNFQIEGHAIIF
jgi:hypothetical protein